MIKFEHTVFALPFAFLGALAAAQGSRRLRTVLWILAAMVGARTAAMTFNRLVDEHLDADNPRTRGPRPARGPREPARRLALLGAGIVLFGFAAGMPWAPCPGLWRRWPCWSSWAIPSASASPPGPIWCSAWPWPGRPWGPGSPWPGAWKPRPGSPAWACSPGPRASTSSTPCRTRTSTAAGAALAPRPLRHPAGALGLPRLPPARARGLGPFNLQMGATSSPGWPGPRWQPFSPGSSGWCAAGISPHRPCFLHPEQSGGPHLFPGAPLEWWLSRAPGADLDSR